MTFLVFPHTSTQFYWAHLNASLSLWSSRLWSEVCVCVCVIDQLCLWRYRYQYSDQQMLSWCFVGECDVKSQWNEKMKLQETNIFYQPHQNKSSLTGPSKPFINWSLINENDNWSSTTSFLSRPQEEIIRAEVFFKDSFFVKVKCTKTKTEMTDGVRLMTNNASYEFMTVRFIGNTEKYYQTWGQFLNHYRCL